MRTEMTEWAAFEDKFFLADCHFNTTLQDQYEVVGRFTLQTTTSKTSEDRMRYATISRKYVDFQ